MPNRAAEKSNGTTVARARLTSNALQDLEVIFRQVPAVDSGGHFGGRLVFARDGRLFVTLGERQAKPFSELAQDLATHFGKVVRIERDGRVPADNPFVGRAGMLCPRPGRWVIATRKAPRCIRSPANSGSRSMARRAGTRSTSPGPGATMAGP